MYIDRNCIIHLMEIFIRTNNRTHSQTFFFSFFTLLVFTNSVSLSLVKNEFKALSLDYSVFSLFLSFWLLRFLALSRERRFSRQELLWILSLHGVAVHSLAAGTLTSDGWRSRSHLSLSPSDRRDPGPFRKESPDTLF